MPNPINSLSLLLTLLDVETPRELSRTSWMISLDGLDMSWSSWSQFAAGNSPQKWIKGMGFRVNSNPETVRLQCCISAETGQYWTLWWPGYQEATCFWSSKWSCLHGNLVDGILYDLIRWHEKLRVPEPKASSSSRMLVLRARVLPRASYEVMQWRGRELHGIAIFCHLGTIGFGHNLCLAACGFADVWVTVFFSDPFAAALSWIKLQEELRECTVYSLYR